MVAHGKWCRDERAFLELMVKIAVLDGDGACNVAYGSRLVNVAVCLVDTCFQ